MFKVQSDSSLEEVRVKAYGKGELAEMYYPDSSPSWALRLFNADLRRMPGLTDALRARGWRPSARLLRIDWVRIIFEAIGPP
ncbi:MAG: DUF4248 domain-containing protein [Bacteroidaceae bacterium]|nr:DUF4248 domain-containing protein [Bacteroidaceae bacterium]